MSADHYHYPNTAQLEVFNVTFDEGVSARSKGALYTECPYGLPNNLDWKPYDLFLYSRSDVAGWLLGWWISDYMHDSDCDHNAYTSAAVGAKRMAGLIASSLPCVRGVVDE